MHEATPPLSLAPADGLRIAAAVALLALGFGLGLWPLLLALHADWTGWYGPFEHGYLVLALALWLGVRHWRAQPPSTLAPAWWSLPALGGVLALLALMELLFIGANRLATLPLLLLAAVLLALGREAAARLGWAALFVYFALPPWWAINGLLQSLTTAVVTRVVAWTGVPAFIEGNFVHIPSGVFEIASGCSGLNYLVVGLALGGFQALMYLSAWRHRIAVVALAAIISLLANWLRVYLLILIGHATQMQHYLIVVDHHLFGWVLFLVCMVPVLLLARRLEEREAGAAPARRAATASRGRVTSVSAAVPLAAALAAALLLLPRLFLATPLEGPLPAAPLPERLAGQPLAAGPASGGGWQPGFVNAAEARGSVGQDESAIEVYRAVYPRQDRDHRLVRGDNDPLGPGLREAGRERLSIAVPGGSLPIVEYRGTLEGRERLVWRYHLAGGHAAAGALETKLAELRGLLRGRRDGVAVLLSSDCRPDCNAARQRLSEFLYAAADDLRWSPPAPTEGTRPETR